MTDASSTRLEVRRGAHVCWMLDDDASYPDAARSFLRDGSSAGDKAIAFAPQGSSESLSVVADVTVDPAVDILHGTTLEPEAIFAFLREQSNIAREVGYAGIRLTADMDWLLPLDPSPGEVTSFELQLDRLVHETRATVVCAYRPWSFDPAMRAAVPCVHPEHAGLRTSPMFRMVAAGEDGWRLSGEIDLEVQNTFEATFNVAANGRFLVDVGELSFIDVDGMRTIAKAAHGSGTAGLLLNARPMFQKIWDLGGFAKLAPEIELVPSVLPNCH